MLNLKEFYARPRVLLAPMAGYTDKTYRTLCFEQGCELACTEMVSGKGLLYDSRRTRALIDKGAQEGLLGVQLFGKEPAVMEEAARRLCGELGDSMALLDINCGCPAKKIAGNGEGSALMLDLSLTYDVISAVVKGSSVPVTVKFRKGYDEEHCNAVDFARMAAEAGASALTIHGRTRTQQYSGISDRTCLRAVKAAVSIPVVGNGDVVDGDSALSIIEETGVDALMIGRGSLGNPWIFREVRCALEGLPYTPPTRQEVCRMVLRHMELVQKDKPERGLLELRKLLPLYFKRERGASKLRIRLQSAGSFEELKRIILDIEAEGTYNNMNRDFVPESKEKL